MRTMFTSPVGEKSEERVNSMPWQQQISRVRSVRSSSQCQDVFWPSPEMLALLVVNLIADAVSSP